MKVRAGALLGFSALLLIVPVVAGAWTMHNHLVKASPAIDGTIKAPPTEVRLWFAEKPERGVSNIRVIAAADSAVVAVGSVKATDDSLSLAAPVSGAMTPGAYLVVYRTAGADGHAIRGRYTFTLNP